jgi:hypothetical protein
MPSRAWRILSALVLSGVLGGWASEVLAKDVPVASFGNWRITFITDNSTYNLIGTGSEPDVYFTVQCHPEKGAATLFLPVWERGYKPVQEPTIHMMVWSDAAGAKEIDLYVSRGMLAVGINSAEHPSDAVPIFIGALADANRYFAFSYLGQTFEFDAKFLKVAWQKFSEECSKLIAQ